MRQGAMGRHRYLRHLAFAFVAGGLLSYLCVSWVGRAGTLDTRGNPTQLYSPLLPVLELTDLRGVL